MPNRMTNQEKRDKAELMAGDAVSMLDEKLLRENYQDREFASMSARSAMGVLNFRSKLFIETYEKAFRIAASNRYHELPDVKAAQKVQSAMWMLERNIKHADDCIAAHLKSLKSDAAYAFENCDQVANATARASVAGIIVRVLEEKGLDYAIMYSRNEAMRGALYPSHSTSSMTNYMKGEYTAAWAEFADKFKEVE